MIITKNNEWRTIDTVPTGWWVELVALPNPGVTLRCIGYEIAYFRSLYMRDGRRPTHWRPIGAN